MMEHTGQIVDESPDRLVLYLPGGGADAKRFFVMTVILTAASIGWTVWFADQFLQRVAPNWVVKVAIALWIGCAVVVPWGIIFRFRKTLLFLDHERMVVQSSLFGFKWRKTITLVAGSRAERIPDHERVLSSAAIKVVGKEGIAWFGHRMATAERDWLLSRVNGFLTERIQTLEAALRSGEFQVEELAHDSQIQVDRTDSDSWQFHYSPISDHIPLHSFGNRVKVYAILGIFLFFIWNLRGMMTVSMLWGFLAIVAIAGLAILCLWLEELNQIVVQVTPSGILCRHRFFGMDLCRPQWIARCQIDGFSVRLGSCGRTFDKTLLGRIHSLSRGTVIPVTSWGVEIKGDEGNAVVILPAFCGEKPAQQACALLQSQLRAWDTVPTDRLGEISGHRDQPHLGMRARWRLVVGVFLIGGVALFDPLLLWLAAPLALSALLLVQAAVVKGAAKLELALAGMASGGIALLLSTAIVPFCMATGPIRLAGGRVTPFGGPFGPPLLGTATECRVQLRGPHISDETLQELAPGFAKLSGISRLDLLGARITTDGMRALLPSLNPSDLVLNGTKVDDDLFPLLAGKTRLRMLAVGWTGISDQGLEQLPSLTWNGWLSVSQTSVGDLGLAQIARQKYVHGLELAGTRVTDAGLAELSQMGELAYLDLDRTNVSDAGLAHLEGLKYLQHLRLKQTNVTDKGVEKLQKQPRKHALRIFR